MKILKGVKRLPTTKILFLILACLLVISCVLLLGVFLTETIVSPPAPVLRPPNETSYHDFKDTRSGKCLKDYFEDMLLIIIYHFPFYESIPMLLSFYNETFKDILICGPKAYSNHYIMVVDFGPGHYGYECAAEAIRRHPGYRGYLYTNDDMIVNWWTFYKLDKEKFWSGSKIFKEKCLLMGSRPIPDDWPWWSKATTSAKSCEDSYAEVTRKNLLDKYINTTEMIRTHLVNGGGVKLCFRTWSDLFYVPKRFSVQFERLSHVFRQNKVFLEAAVPTIMSLLDYQDDWEMHFGLYLPDKYGHLEFADGKLIWQSYTYDMNFIHPVKFHGDIAKRNREKLKNDIIPYSKQFTKC